MGFVSQPGGGGGGGVPQSYVDARLPRVYVPEDYGAAGDNSTDDTTAFRDLMADINMAYGADIVLDPDKIYLVNGAPDTSVFGNAIIPLPLEGDALGTVSNYPFYRWLRPTIRFRSLYGTACIRTTRTTDVYATSLGTCTISNASPGVVTLTAHGLPANAAIHLTTTGTLPTGLTTNKVYFVRNPTANTFELSATHGGSSINTSSAGSGTHTAHRTYGPPSVIGGPTFEQGATAGPMASINHVEFDGVAVQVPNIPAISGVDLWYTGQNTIKDLVVCTPQTSVGGVSAPNDVDACTNKWVFGVRLANAFAQAKIDVQNISTQGTYAGVVIDQAHNRVGLIHAAFHEVALALTAFDTGHSSQIEYAVLNQNKHYLGGWDPLTGVKSLAATDIFNLTGSKLNFEVGGGDWAVTQHVLDANDSIRGSIGYHIWPHATDLNISGAKRLDLYPCHASGSRARIRRTTTQTLTTGVTADISYDTEVIDTDNYYDAGSPTLLTAPRHGLYRLEVHATFAANTTGRRSITAQTSSPAALIVDNRNFTAAGNVHCHLVKEIEMDKDSTVKVIALQDSGGNLNLSADNPAAGTTQTMTLTYIGKPS